MPSQRSARRRQWWPCPNPWPETWRPMRKWQEMSIFVSGINLWISLDIFGYLWISLDIFGYLWISLDIGYIYDIYVYLCHISWTLMPISRINSRISNTQYPISNTFDWVFSLQENWGPCSIQHISSSPRFFAHLELWNGFHGVLLWVVQASLGVSTETRPKSDKGKNRTCAK